MSEIQKQGDYYRDTAHTYDSSCCHDPNDEHYIASALLTGLLDHYRINTVLDVGCGTVHAGDAARPPW